MSLLYTTTRSFPAVNNEGDYEAVLNIPIIYRDCHVLHVGAELDLKNDLNLPDDIDKLAEIYVPTARTIRLTLRAVGEDKPSNPDYYGLLNPNPEPGRALWTDHPDAHVTAPPEMRQNLFVNAAPARGAARDLFAARSAQCV